MKNEPSSDVSSNKVHRTEVESVTDDLHEAFVLQVVMQGYSEQEVAQRFGWTEDKVHRTKKRALARLRGILDEP